MTYITRDLLSFGIGRNAGERVTLITKIFSQVGDGSYSSIVDETSILARVVDLQPNQIKRLQERGITVQNGISISIVGELPRSPDQVVRQDGSIYKIIDFTISENASIFIADRPPLGAA